MAANQVLFRSRRSRVPRFIYML